MTKQNMKWVLRLIADVLILLIGFWLGCTIVHAIADSSVPTSMTNILFRMSEVLGDALCKVFGL